MNFEDLKKPFPPEQVSWRVGSTTKDKSKGMALAYIDARDVQDRLDEVCGVGGWQCRYVPMHDKKTVCEIGILVPDGSVKEWIWKADGAGDSDVEAEKGALSDAFKRAAVRWGVGRYLYDIESPWVALEASGSSYKIAASEYAKLRTVLGAKKQEIAPAPSPTSHKMTPAQWVDQASAELIALRTPAELGAWLKKNAKAMDAMQSADKALYNTVNTKISLRNDELQRAAA